MTGVEFEDRSLPHQKIIYLTGPGSGLLAVSCNCRCTPEGRRIPLAEPSRLLDADRAKALYDAHLAEQEPEELDAGPREFWQLPDDGAPRHPDGTLAHDPQGGTRLTVSVHDYSRSRVSNIGSH